MARGPQNQWDDDQRTVLHLLFSRYGLSQHSKVAIFNHVFHEHLRGRRLPDGLTSNKLDVQYGEHDLEHKQHLWEVALNNPSGAVEQAHRESLIARIEDAATALSIPLQQAERGEQAGNASSSSAGPTSKRARDDIEIDPALDSAIPTAKKFKAVTLPSNTPMQTPRRSTRTPRTIAADIATATPAIAPKPVLASKVVPTLATPTAQSESRPAAKPPRAKTAEISSAIGPTARLPPYKLGAVEIVTFFPHHLQWPEARLRLVRNGWTARDIALATLYARNKLDYRSDAIVKTYDATNRKTVTQAGQYFFDDPNFKASKSSEMTPVTTYDASTYAPRPHVKTLYTANLVDIARGVKEWPKGEDRGVVTQAIEFAVKHNILDVNTDDMPHLMVDQGLRLQDPQESFGPTWDQGALKRMRARIEISGNYRTKRFEEAYMSDEDEDQDGEVEDGEVEDGEFQDGEFEDGEVEEAGEDQGREYGEVGEEEEFLYDPDA